MKSAHRHQLETNVLAQRLEQYVARYRPYTSRIIGVLVAVLVLILVWTFVAGNSAKSRSEAWDSYNRALGGTQVNPDEIHRTAQEYPNTTMQQMADVTWADAQVWMASRIYLNNRKPAMDALERAASAYQGVIQTSSDENLVGRARLGLARIYEMQNHLDKARDEYRRVTGAYARYGKDQAERLDKPEAQDIYNWLATAQAPPVAAGTPGKPLDFSPGELSLPSGAAPGGTKAEDAKAGTEAIEDLLRGLNDDSKKSNAPDRYKTDQKSSKDSSTAPPAKAAPLTDPKSSAAPAKSEASGSKAPESTPASKATAK
jgi:predicted negative regulator of RcsB-dependent stress response